MSSPTYNYAKLPVFKYQTFDRASLQFSDVPIVPPDYKTPLVFKGTDKDDQQEEAAATTESSPAEGSTESAETTNAAPPDTDPAQDSSSKCLWFL